MRFALFFVEKLFNLNFAICLLGKLDLVIESVALQCLLFGLNNRFLQFYDLRHRLVQITTKPLVDLANN
jgi:hypothetical protein